jgi:pimeloyl-ACP methyl ester carboxylesterase
MYQALRLSRSEFVPIRKLKHHVRLWGEPSPDQIPLVLLHGWMDVAASYQFVVDALAHNHYVIAPDWRGFGLSESGEVDHFWYPDYLADLDGLLDHYAPHGPVNLVGHSMGGNVAMMYAGVRPERIRRLINLEGFGLPATTPSQAPSRYAKWMDEVKALNRGEKVLKTYKSVDGVARRLMKTNPRLSPDKAAWLAQHWAKESAPGQWRILGDPAHKVINAQLYRVDEVLAVFQQISMPVLMVEAEDDSITTWWKGQYNRAQHRERLQAVPQVEIAIVSDAGHMLHHDQPALVATLMTRFLAAGD